MALQHIGKSPPPQYTEGANRGELSAMAICSQADSKDVLPGTANISERVDSDESDQGTTSAVSDALSAGEGQVRKKRKGPDGEEVDDWHRDYLLQRRSNFELRDEVLELRGVIVGNKDTISRLKLKNNADKIERRREQALAKEDEDKLIEAHVDSIKKLKEEALRLKVKENAARKAANEFEMQNLTLKQQLKHMQLARGPRPARHEPSLIPDLNRTVRQHPSYLHPEAPRENQMYKWFESSPQVVYPLETGKVFVNKYGSNCNWDLGLCRIRFSLGRDCHVQGCEYRHKPLTQKEQIYMRFLAPEGPKYLDDVAEANVQERCKVLL